MHCTDKHLSSSFARNSTNAAWTSSRGGAGRFEPGVVLGVLFGLGVTRIGVSIMPCGGRDGPPFVKPWIGVLLAGMPLLMGAVEVWEIVGVVKPLGGPPMSSEDCGRGALAWFWRPGHSRRCCFWRDVFLARICWQYMHWTLMHLSSSGMAKANQQSSCKD